jgi:hypothetical protein
MTTSVQTLFGNFNEEQLKALKGAIDEMEIVMHKQDALKTEMKDILDATFDALNVPKKILRKLVRVQYKNSFQEEVAESKEFEALFEGITEVH